jgi:hypothetical protein
MLLHEEEHREHQVLDTDVQNYGSKIEESQITLIQCQQAEALQYQLTLVRIVIQVVVP